MVGSRRRDRIRARGDIRCQESSIESGFGEKRRSRAWLDGWCQVRVSRLDGCQGEWAAEGGSEGVRTMQDEDAPSQQREQGGGAAAARRDALGKVCGLGGIVEWSWQRATGTYLAAGAWRRGLRGLPGDGVGKASRASDGTTLDGTRPRHGMDTAICNLASATGQAIRQEPDSVKCSGPWQQTHAGKQ